jgi:hypothetical protein
MDEATWATCREPAEMLNFLRASGRGSGRKLRLLACAFCRAVAPLLTDERYRSALDVAERYADGLASTGELHDAGRVVANAIRHTDEYEWSEEKQALLLAANAVGWAATLREPPDPPAYLAGCAATGARSAALTAGVSQAEANAAQSALIRDILGNPFRPVALDPAVLGTAIPSLAQAAYEERALPGRELDPARLAVLADALEEAGCTDAALLDHLRGPGPHCRGCWAVDLVLGKG